MRWRLVNKKPGFQPSKGTYSDWKQLLSDEACQICVYCSIHESNMGGIRNFHVEHFRPKSLFDALTNVFSNLFYSCPICNVFKSNDWPNEPDGTNHIHTICYPDPSVINYADLFDVDTNTGLIHGKNISAEYIQNKLFLNRPQLITDRKLLILNEEVDRIALEINEYIAKLEKLGMNPAAFDLLTEMLKWAVDIIAIQSALSKAIPYKIDDITKK